MYEKATTWNKISNTELNSRVCFVDIAIPQQKVTWNLQIRNVRELLRAAMIVVSWTQIPLPCHLKLLFLGTYDWYGRHFVSTWIETLLGIWRVRLVCWTIPNTPLAATVSNEDYTSYIRKLVPMPIKRGRRKRDRSKMQIHVKPMIPRFCRMKARKRHQMKCQISIIMLIFSALF